jgi:hypothetical protein
VRLERQARERQLSRETKRRHLAGVAFHEQQQSEACGKVDRAFTNEIIEELADIISVPKHQLAEFAKNVRTSARVFVQSRARLSHPALRDKLEQLYQLCSRAKHGGDRAAGALCRAVDAAPPEVWEWLDKFSSDSMPMPEEILDRATREKAVQQLHLVLSYGGKMVDGRKRKTTKRKSGRSRSFEPLIRVPLNIPRNRPRSQAEREFLLHLTIDYQQATGNLPPNTVHSQKPGPFLRFIRRCFELAGGKSGSIPELINERGKIRRRQKPRQRGKKTGPKKEGLSPTSA